MLYKIGLFLHVSGALLLCAAMAVEWLYIIHLRKAGTFERIRDIMHSYASLGKIGGIAMILILIPGFYMTAVAWHDAGWVTTGLGPFILIGLIGGIVTGRKRNKIKKVIKRDNNLSPELRSLLEDSSIRVSMQLRTCIFAGIIFLMTVKPDLTDSIITIVISVIIGVIPLKKRSYRLVAERNKAAQN